MLDKSQPWMSNPAMKVRILMTEKRMANPVMRQFQEEFQKLALVPIDAQPREERKERREFL